MQTEKRGFFRRFIRLLTAVIVGGAIGSILGMIFAPKKGKETRDYLREQGSEIYQKGRSFLQEGAHSSLTPQQVGMVKRIIIKAFRLKKKDNISKE